MHVRGLTRATSSGVEHPGTYLGLIEKIPYLKSLGVTAVELMPVHEFPTNGFWGERRSRGNYWGYDSLAFFSPHRGYAAGNEPGCQVNEFKQMVRALHQAGIEVILDVVFNHTAEGNELGPTLSFKGLENQVYYMLDGGGAYYKNYSGCGNTINGNHPIVREMIFLCLRHWVHNYHVDGFRFDLASILSRDRQGELVPNPPVVEAIAEDPLLADSKIIAEAWDASGAYQVGSFAQLRWAEWNGRFRDDVRRFWRGDSGMTPPLATRLAGSSDLYQAGGRQPYHSINFITSHDGFTLNDLVSYGEKHNEANEEGNRDGESNNYGSSYGVEGPTRNQDIEALRLRQIKNMLATLFLSQGVPMLLAGDECRRTQGQQQRLLPGQFAVVVRLEAGGEERRPGAILPGPYRVSPQPTGRAASQFPAGRAGASGRNARCVMVWARRPEDELDRRQPEPDVFLRRAARRTVATAGPQRAADVPCRPRAARVCYARFAQTDRLASFSGNAAGQPQRRLPQSRWPGATAAGARLARASFDGRVCLGGLEAVAITAPAPLAP